MTQKKSSKDEDVKTEEKPAEDDIDVVIEGEGDSGLDVKAESDKKPEIKQEDDVTELRKRLEELKAAQELSATRAVEAERQAQAMAAQVNNFRQSAQQSQYDTIVTAMGAAQAEIDNAKRDIMLSGAAQDYSAMADAQERLAAAKAHMIGLEQGKQSFERGGEAQQQNDPLVSLVDQNQNLTNAEKTWLRQHPDAILDARKYAKLNSAYYDAVDQGFQRGTDDYFKFMEEQLGYRQSTPKVDDRKGQPVEESSVMVAAPPSREVSNTGTGGSGKKFTLSREEAEIARLTGISPAEYVKQRETLRQQKRINPGDYPERG